MLVRQLDYPLPLLERERRTGGILEVRHEVHERRNLACERRLQPLEDFVPWRSREDRVDDRVEGDACASGRAGALKKS